MLGKLDTHKEKDEFGPLLHTKQQKLTQNESQTNISYYM